MAKHMHTVGALFGGEAWARAPWPPLNPVLRWAPFLLVFSKSSPRFSGILQRFSQILPRFPCFFPDFHQTKTLGGAFAWASEGGAKRAFALPLEIGTKNQNFLENMNSAAQFRLFNLIRAMTVYLPV